MAPFSTRVCDLLASCNDPSPRTIVSRLAQSESQLRSQWHSPSDILSLLLILGPEVVQRALAQLSGTSGLAVITLQISIAVIPLALFSEWATLVLVISGIFLGSAQAALPQWRREKWACPMKGKTISITRGNGHRHVVVLLSSPKGLDLEILATGSNGQQGLPFITKIAVGILATCWIILLISVAGLKQGSWYLLAIGTIGMIQNIIVAASPRSPGAFGLHLDFVQTIKAAKVSKALMAAEQSYPGIGTSLLSIFHPNGFHAPEDEVDFWRRAGSETIQNQNEAPSVVKVDEPPAPSSKPIPK
ncbi:MAG: hypothetical protein Q9195_000233 [Heterodermia aff. obscurata]